MSVLLELFRGQGGASEGYRGAGWTVFGVDNQASVLKRGYAAGTHCGDALVVLSTLLAGGTVPFALRDGATVHLGLADINAIHASPPCQGYTIATAGNPAARAKHVRLIAAVRELLVATGKPWVIENVEQAKSQMIDPILLCGRMFGLGTNDADGTPLVLDRHRLFESNVPLVAPEHPLHGREQVAGVYGGSRRAKRRCPRNEKGRVVCRRLPCEHETYASLAPRDRDAARLDRGGGYVPRSTSVKQLLLGIDWMTVEGMEESIPPVYACDIGLQLRKHLREEAKRCDWCEEPDELGRHLHSCRLGTAPDELFECPKCFTAAPWTDGIEGGGDSPAEYWCQTCGAEVPLSHCRQVAA